MAVNIDMLQVDHDADFPFPHITSLNCYQILATVLL